MSARLRLRRPIHRFLSLPLVFLLGAILAGSAASSTGASSTAESALAPSAPFGAVGALVAAGPSATTALVPTLLHFNGAPPDAGCTGIGPADVAASGNACSNLVPTATLSPTNVGTWPANATFDGTGARNVYDPNWVWVPQVETRLAGPMTIKWWAACTACIPIGADWTIRLWADGVVVFETTGVTATPTTPEVPELLTTFDPFQLPDVTASTFVLHIDPTFLDTGQGTRIYYDSAIACPGAASGPCDSTVEMPVITGPTAVRLVSFAASDARGRVALRWRTAGETDAVGYNIWRGRLGAEKKINRTLIPARGAVSGAAYRLVDPTVRRGGSYLYRLQVVNRDGSRSWHANARVRTAR
jgi:hypothetical protein